MDPKIQSKTPGIFPHTRKTKEEHVQKKGKTGSKQIANIEGSSKLSPTAKKTPRPLPPLPPKSDSTASKNQNKDETNVEQPAAITHYLGKETLSPQPPDNENDKKSQLSGLNEQLTVALHKHQKTSETLKSYRSDLQTLQEKYPPDVLKEMPKQEKNEIQKQIKEAKHKLWEIKKEFDEGWMEVANLKAQIFKLDPEIETQRKPPPEVLKPPSKPLTKSALPKDDDGIFPLSPAAQLAKSQKDRKVLHFKLLSIENKLKDLYLEQQGGQGIKDEELDRQIDQLEKEKGQISGDISRLDEEIKLLFKASQRSIESEFAFIKEHIEACENNLKTALASGNPEKIKAAREQLEQAKQELLDAEAILNPKLKKLESDQKFIQNTGAQFKPVIEPVRTVDAKPKIEASPVVSNEPVTQNTESATQIVKTETKIGAETINASPDKSMLPQMKEQSSEMTGESPERELDMQQTADEISLENETNIIETSVQEDGENLLPTESEPSSQQTQSSQPLAFHTAESPNAKAHKMQEDLQRTSEQFKEPSSGLPHSPKPSQTFTQALTKSEVKIQELVLNDKKEMLKRALEDHAVIKEDLQWTVDDYVIELKRVAQALSYLPNELRQAILERLPLANIEKSSPETRILAEQLIKNLQGLVHLHQNLKAKELEYQHIVAQVEKRARILEQEWQFFEEKGEQIRELFPGNVLRKPPQLKEADLVRKEPVATIQRAIEKFNELVVIQMALERSQIEGGQYTVAINLAGQMSQQLSRGPIGEAGRVKTQDEEKRDVETAQRGSESGKGGSEGGTRQGGSGGGRQDGGADSQDKGDKEDRNKEKGRDNDDPDQSNMSGRKVRIVKFT